MFLKINETIRIEMPILIQIMSLNANFSDSLHKQVCLTP